MENTNIVEQPANVPTEQPANIPTEQPANIPAEQPANVTAEQPANVPAEQPANVPSEQPAEVPETVNPEQIAEIRTVEIPSVEIVGPIEQPEQTLAAAQETTLKQVTDDYVNSLLQPYRDALAAATTVDAILQWIPAVVPEVSEQIIPVVSTIVDVEAAKVFTIGTFKSMLVRGVIDVIHSDIDDLTPWDLAENRNKMLIRLFGADAQQLPITVVVVDKAYAHVLSEEFAYGLSVGLSGVPGFGLFLNTSQITPDVFAGKYNNLAARQSDLAARYSATIGDINYQFRTPDFVQGIQTAAQWRGVNAHTLITKLSQLQGTTEVILNF